MAVLTLLAATLLFHIADPRVDEASGIATSVVDSGVVYVQNDSGDSARFFALDIHTGRTVATYTVPNATNIDWEESLSSGSSSCGWSAGGADELSDGYGTLGGVTESVHRERR